MFFSSRGLWYGESEFQSPGTILAFTLVFFVPFVGFFVSLFKSSFLKWIQIFILWVSELQSLRMLFKLLKSLSEQQVAAPRRSESLSLSHKVCLFLFGKVSARRRYWSEISLYKTSLPYNKIYNLHHAFEGTLAPCLSNIPLRHAPQMLTGWALQRLGHS